MRESQFGTDTFVLWPIGFVLSPPRRAASIEELNAGHSPPRPTSHASGGGPILGGFSADDEGENDDDDNDLEEAIR